MNRLRLRHVILLWICGPFLLWLSLFRPVGEDAGRADRLPAVLGGYRQVESYELSAETLHMLGTPDAVQRRYAGPGGEVFVVAVFHDQDWKSVHPPDTCLRGSNMTVIEESVENLPAADGGERSAGRLRLHAIDRDQDYVSHYAYLAAPDFVTGAYASFFLHHAPRALWRASVSGCLLRVETWVEPGGLAAADARCRQVLQRSIDAAWEILR